jgi:hypothetical protein
LHLGVTALVVGLDEIGFYLLRHGLSTARGASAAEKESAKIKRVPFDNATTRAL